MKEQMCFPLRQLDITKFKLNINLGEVIPIYKILMFPFKY